MTNRTAKADVNLILALALGVMIGFALVNRDVLPPGPIPEPEPEPTPGAISVLIVEETEDRLQPEMRPYLEVWNSVEIRKYLNAHCKEIDGEPGWLWIDDDADMTNAGEFWKDAMSQPRKSLPWIAITNGRKGVAGPLPPSEAETLALLRKWGGP